PVPGSRPDAARKVIAKYPEAFRTIFDLNVIAPLRMIQAVIPAMRAQGGGAIVNISSGTTTVVPAGFAAYAATKSALETLSSGAWKELEPDGITVSVLLPYITSTGFHENLRQGARRAPQWPGMPPAHTPEFVARWIVSTLESGDRSVVLTPDALEPPPLES
ncbi:MAG: SDR family NAD(P)-dependent oxidoreductase, partial [Thermomicrobiales bacterium]